MLRLIVIALLAASSLVAQVRVFGVGGEVSTGQTTGNVAYFSDGSTVTGAAGFTRVAAGQFTLQAPASETLFLLKNATTQSGNIFEHLTSGDTILSRMTTGGRLDTQLSQTFGIAIGGVTTPTSVTPLIVQPTLATRVAATVRGFTSQTANLMEYQTSAPAVLSSITAQGLFVPVNSATEPADCASGIYGATYYDTSDNELCTCRDDGTDEEWVKESDPTHTGHCSI